MLLPVYWGPLFNDFLALVIGFLLYVNLTEGKASSDERASYAPGQAIPVSCLNRTMYAVFMSYLELFCIAEFYSFSLEQPLI